MIRILRRRPTPAEIQLAREQLDQLNSMAASFRIHLDAHIYGDRLGRAQRDLEDVQWRLVVLGERMAARSWWDEQATAMWGRYGWERGDA